MKRYDRVSASIKVQQAILTFAQERGSITATEGRQLAMYLTDGSVSQRDGAWKTVNNAGLITAERTGQYVITPAGVAILNQWNEEHGSAQETVNEWKAISE